MHNIYLIGSLRNPRIPEIANRLRGEGHGVFDDWFAAGPEADDYWQSYEQGRGHTFAQALDGYSAHHVFEYDKTHLSRCDTVVLALPAGKSAHMEFGFGVGIGKLGFILLEGEPERYDVMYRFANQVFTSLDDLVIRLRESHVGQAGQGSSGRDVIVGSVTAEEPHHWGNSDGYGAGV